MEDTRKVNQMLAGIERSGRAHSSALWTRISNHTSRDLRKDFWTVRAFKMVAGICLLGSLISGTLFLASLLLGGLNKDFFLASTFLFGFFAFGAICWAAPATSSIDGLCTIHQKLIRWTGAEPAVFVFFDDQKLQDLATGIIINAAKCILQQERETKLNGRNTQQIAAHAKLTDDFKEKFDFFSGLGLTRTDGYKQYFVAAERLLELQE